MAIGVRRWKESVSGHGIPVIKMSVAVAVTRPWVTCTLEISVCRWAFALFSISSLILVRDCYSCWMRRDLGLVVTGVETVDLRDKIQV